MTSAFAVPRTRVLAVAVAAALLALVASQLVAQHPAGNAGAASVGTVRINMTVLGRHQGNFKGDILTGKAASNLINVFAYQYSVTSPRDVASGLPTGHRVHHPLVITHELGASSPQFFEAITTNETLDKVVINFFRTQANGKEVNFYRVTLTNASASEFKQFSSGSTVLEDISFTFQKIEQQDLLAGTIAVDDWAIVT